MDESGNDTIVDNKMTVRQAVRHALLLGGATLASSFVLAGSAIAQEQTEEQTEQLDEVVVTGSRLTRSGFDSPTPMDVVNVRDAISLGYTNTADMLMSQPVLSGSDQMTDVMSGILSNTNGGQGVQTADLRGLGAGRTLSLLNGRRAGPAGIRDGVTSFDINVIPVSALERIEILKDGASSVYGSDAIGGVINYITRKGDGGEFNAYTQIAEETGGEILQINASYGKESDRGYWRVAMDYNKQEEILKGDRSVFDCEHEYIFNEPSLDTRADVLDPSTNEYKCQGFDAGSQWVYDYHHRTIYGDNSVELGLGGETSNVTRTSTRVVYDWDGSIAASGLLPDRNNGADDPADLRVPEGWYILPNSAVGESLRPYSGDFNENDTMVPERERFTVFANGEFDLTDDVSLYAEALFNRRETHHEYTDELWTYNYTSDWSYHYDTAWSYSYDTYDYYYYSGVYWGPGGDPVSTGWTGAQILDPIIPFNDGGISTKVDYTRFVLGIEGDIGDSDWSFDISTQYSNSDGEYEDGVLLSDSRFESANRVAWWYGDHMGLCEGTSFDRYGPDGEVRSTVECVDLNFLDPRVLDGDFTDEERDFLFAIESGTTDYTNMSFDVGFVNNELFSMPAGKVGIAAGAQFMTDEIADTPGIESRSGNNWDGGTIGRSSAFIFGTYGETSTQAAYLETAIPLLANKGIADYLELNASARYTKVSIDNTEDSDARDFTGTTYKVGLNWTINDNLRVRAGHGTSFRTPALFELYRKNFHTNVAQNGADPCWEWGAALAANEISQEVAGNCAAEGIPDNIASLIGIDVVTGGGAAHLDAETSVSESLGFVWTATNIDLRFSVDYWSVEVDDQIGFYEASDILEGCYESENFPDDQRCALIEREAPNVPVEGHRVKTIQASYINLDTQRTSGWDIEASYGTELANGMGLSISTSHMLTETKETESQQGAKTSRLGRAGNPEWVGNLTTRLYKGPWAATWRMNYVDGTDQNRGRQTPLAASGTWIGFSGEEETYYYSRKLDSRIYHNMSFNYEFGSGWQANLSVTNVTNELPPRATEGGGLRIEGYGAFHSQYDWKGRRYGLNVKKEF